MKKAYIGKQILGNVDAQHMGVICTCLPTFLKARNLFQNKKQQIKRMGNLKDDRVP